MFNDEDVSIILSLNALHLVSSRKADPSSSQRAASWGKEAAEEAMKLETSTVSKL